MGRHEETIAGKVKVSFDDHGNPIVTDIIDGTTEITINAPDEGCFKKGK